MIVEEESRFGLSWRTLVRFRARRGGHIVLGRLGGGPGGRKGLVRRTNACERIIGRLFHVTSQVGCFIRVDDPREAMKPLLDCRRRGSVGKAQCPCRVRRRNARSIEYGPDRCLGLSIHGKGWELLPDKEAA